MSGSRPCAMTARLVATTVLCVAAFAGPAAARADTVHAGLTPGELADFSRNEGWSAQVDAGASAVVTIQVKGQSARVEMFDCDQQRRCMSGVIRDLTYYNLDPDHYGFWHWNLGNPGATGFGPSYITLQRYIHFNGVTDRYLRDILGTIWPGAARSFWDQVKQRYDAEERQGKAE